MKMLKGRAVSNRLSFIGTFDVYWPFSSPKTDAHRILVWFTMSA